tara:strand:- start:15814 stop:16665 length:852 start_codon:yes stop_codon:yes gene_type:complete
MRLTSPPSYGRKIWFDLSNDYTWDFLNSQPKQTDRVLKVRDVDNESIELTSPSVNQCPRLCGFSNYNAIIQGPGMSDGRDFLQFHGDVMSSNAITPYPLTSWPMTFYVVFGYQNNPVGSWFGTYIFFGSSTGNDQIAIRNDSSSNKGLGFQIYSTATGITDNITLGSNQGLRNNISVSKCFQILRCVIGLNEMKVYINGILCRTFAQAPPAFPVGLDHISFGRKTDPTPTAYADWYNGFSEVLVYEDDHSDDIAEYIEGQYLAKKWGVPWGHLSTGWGPWPNN